MYNKTVWYITDHDTIDFVVAVTPKGVQRYIESLHRASTDVQQVAKWLREGK